MLIESSKFDELFNEATRRGARAGSPIVLFVALDCDALCASRILSVRLPPPGTRAGPDDPLPPAAAATNETARGPA